MKSRNGNVCVYSSHINDLGVAVVKQWGKNIHFVVLCLFRCLGRPEGAEASASEHSRAQRLWVDDLVPLTVQKLLRPRPVSALAIRSNTPHSKRGHRARAQEFLDGGGVVKDSAKSKKISQDP